MLEKNQNLNIMLSFKRKSLINSYIFGIRSRDHNARGIQNSEYVFYGHRNTKIKLQSGMGGWVNPASLSQRFNNIICRANQHPITKKLYLINSPQFIKSHPQVVGQRGRLKKNIKNYSNFNTNYSRLINLSINNKTIGSSIFACHLSSYNSKDKTTIQSAKELLRRPANWKAPETFNNSDQSVHNTLYRNIKTTQHVGKFNMKTERASRNASGWVSQPSTINKKINYQNISWKRFTPTAHKNIGKGYKSSVTSQNLFQSRILSAQAKNKNSRKNKGRFSLPNIRQKKSFRIFKKRYFKFSARRFNLRATQKRINHVFKFAKEHGIKFFIKNSFLDFSKWFKPIKNNLNFSLSAKSENNIKRVAHRNRFVQHSNFNNKYTRLAGLRTQPKPTTYGVGVTTGVLNSLPTSTALYYLKTSDLKTNILNKKALYLKGLNYFMNYFNLVLERNYNLYNWTDYEVMLKTDLDNSLKNKLIYEWLRNRSVFNYKNSNIFYLKNNGLNNSVIGKMEVNNLNIGLPEIFTIFDINNGHNKFIENKSSHQNNVTRFALEDNNVSGRTHALAKGAHENEKQILKMDEDDHSARLKIKDDYIFTRLKFNKRLVKTLNLNIINITSPKGTLSTLQDIKKENYQKELKEWNFALNLVEWIRKEKLLFSSYEYEKSLANIVSHNKIFNSRHASTKDFFLKNKKEKHLINYRDQVNNLKSIKIEDQYIVNNLLLQKLILSKYRATILRSKLLRYRLSIIFGKNLFFSSVSSRTGVESNLDSFNKEISFIKQAPSPILNYIPQITKKNVTYNTTNSANFSNINIRRAIIKLYKGPNPNANKLKLSIFKNNKHTSPRTAPAINNNGVWGLRRNFIDNTFTNYSKYFNNLGKAKPNLRNLKIILRRIISKPLPFNSKNKNKLNFGGDTLSPTAHKANPVTKKISPLTRQGDKGAKGLLSSPWGQNVLREGVMRGGSTKAIARSARVIKIRTQPRNRELCKNYLINSGSLSSFIKIIKDLKIKSLSAFGKKIPRRLFKKGSKNYSRRFVSARLSASLSAAPGQAGDVQAQDPKGSGEFNYGIERDSSNAYNLYKKLFFAEFLNIFERGTEEHNSNLKASSINKLEAKPIYTNITIKKKELKQEAYTARIKINREFNKLLFKSLLYKKINKISRNYGGNSTRKSLKNILSKSQDIANSSNNFFSIINRLIRAKRIKKLYSNSKLAKKIFKTLPNLYENDGNYYKGGAVREEQIIYKNLSNNTVHTGLVAYPTPKYNNKNINNKFNLLLNVYDAQINTDKKFINKSYAVSSPLTRVARIALGERDNGLMQNSKKIGINLPYFIFNYLAWGVKNPKSYIIKSLINIRNKNIFKIVNKNKLIFKNILKKEKKRNRLNNRRRAGWSGDRVGLSTQPNLVQPSVENRIYPLPAFSASRSNLIKNKNTVNAPKPTTAVLNNKIFKISTPVSPLAEKFLADNYLNSATDVKPQGAVYGAQPTSQVVGDNFKIFMRNNFVNYMFQKYIINSMRSHNYFELINIKKENNNLNNNVQPYLFVSQANRDHKLNKYPHLNEMWKLLPVKSNKLIMYPNPKGEEVLDFKNITAQTVGQHTLNYQEISTLKTDYLKIKTNISHSPMSSTTHTGYGDNYTNSWMLNLKKKMPYLTLSNRYPDLGYNDANSSITSSSGKPSTASRGAGVSTHTAPWHTEKLSLKVSGLIRSPNLFIHSNTYNIIEKNINNFKFKLNYPKFNFKLKKVINNKFSNKLYNLSFNYWETQPMAAMISKKQDWLLNNMSDSVKQSWPLKTSSNYSNYLNAEDAPRSVNEIFTETRPLLSLSKEGKEKNQELQVSSINHWLLEQEKQRKRSFMNPHLSLLNNNRTTSFKSRVNFLKLNQLGFLYSKGLFKNDLIFDKFLDKILQMDLIINKRLSFVFFNPVTDTIKFIRKDLKKGKSYLKKNLNKILKNYKKQGLKSYYYDNFFNSGKFVESVNNRNYLIYSKKENKKRKKILRKYQISEYNLIFHKLWKKKMKTINTVSTIIKKRMNSLSTSKKALLKKKIKLASLYPFLIDKKIAQKNLFLLFFLENYLYDSVYEDKRLLIEKKFGKKALKAIGIKNKGRRKIKIKVNFLLKTIKKIIPYYIYKIFFLYLWNSPVRTPSLPYGAAAGGLDYISSSTQPAQRLAQPIFMLSKFAQNSIPNYPYPKWKIYSEIKNKSKSRKYIGKFLIEKLTKRSTFRVRQHGIRNLKNKEHISAKKKNINSNYKSFTVRNTLKMKAQCADLYSLNTSTISNILAPHYTFKNLLLNCKVEKVDLNNSSRGTEPEYNKFKNLFNLYKKAKTLIKNDKFMFNAFDSSAHTEPKNNNNQINKPIRERGVRSFILNTEQTVYDAHRAYKTNNSGMNIKLAYRLKNLYKLSYILLNKGLQASKGISVNKSAPVSGSAKLIREGAMRGGSTKTIIISVFADSRETLDLLINKYYSMLHAHNKENKLNKKNIIINRRLNRWLKKYQFKLHAYARKFLLPTEAKDVYGSNNSTILDLNSFDRQKKIKKLLRIGNRLLRKKTSEKTIIKMSIKNLSLINSKKKINTSLMSDRVHDKNKFMSMLPKYTNNLGQGISGLSKFAEKIVIINKLYKFPLFNTQNLVSQGREESKELFKNYNLKIALAYLGNYFWAHYLSENKKDVARSFYLNENDDSYLKINKITHASSINHNKKSNQTLHPAKLKYKLLINSKSMIKRKKILKEFKVKLLYSNYLNSNLKNNVEIPFLAAGRLTQPSLPTFTKNKKFFIELHSVHTEPHNNTSIPFKAQSAEEKQNYINISDKSEKINKTVVPVEKYTQINKDSDANNYNSINKFLNTNSKNNLYGCPAGSETSNLELSGSLSPFFDFLIDNKNINLKNELGLRKILSEFKFYRYFEFAGPKTGIKQIISYSFSKNISRTNTLNSFDHTGSLLKVSISVILKYFFNIMGSALISKPIFVFSHNKVTIQISYFIYKNLFFSNRNTKNWNEYVSTMSMGMQFYWPIVWKKYKLIPKRYMEESGVNSLWKMKNLFQFKNPFTTEQENLQIYPGNLPYLAQYKYRNFVYGRIKKMRKLAGGYYNHEKKKYVKNPFYFAKYDRIKHTIPFVKNTLSFFHKELKFLTYFLENFFNCSIKLELSKIKTPYSDTNIMAQLIGINGEEYKFERIKRLFFSEFFYWNPNDPKNKFRFNILSNNKPFLAKKNTSRLSEVSGIKVRVAGRFYKHRIIPRRTVNVVSRGSLARKVVGTVDKARYINKSKRGSFSVTVWISYNF